MMDSGWFLETCLGFRQRYWIALEAEPSEEVVLIARVGGTGLDGLCRGGGAMQKNLVFRRCS